MPECRIGRARLVLQTICSRSARCRPFVGLVTALALFIGGFASASADPGFNAWVKGFRGEALAAGVSAQVFDRAFSGLKPDPEILDKASNQPEFVRPIGDYLNAAVTDSRIETGREKAQEWKSWLDRIERRFGVDRHVILAIWGMESTYGAVLDNPRIVRNVIRSLATLAYKGGKRRKFGKTQLIAALMILQRGDTVPARMTGSWAGAMGHTQFIPTTYNAYAVDIDSDGSRNIWTSVPDALASTANYLSESGWRTGETWGYEVLVPSTFDFAAADGAKSRTLAAWIRLGLRRTGGRSFPRPNDKATLMLPAGARGPAFLMLKNFRVIKRYNNADAYALAVGHLADRIRGGAPFERTWPADDPPISSRKAIREMQALLSKRGFDTGGVDGRIGPKTRRAIRTFQKQSGMIPDAYPSARLLDRLRGG